MAEFQVAFAALIQASKGAQKKALQAIAADAANLKAVYAAAKLHPQAAANARGKVDWNALLQQLMPSFIALLAKIPPR